MTWEVLHNVTSIRVKTDTPILRNPNDGQENYRGGGKKNLDLSRPTSLFFSPTKLHNKDKAAKLTLRKVNRPWKISVFKLLGKSQLT